MIQNYTLLALILVLNIGFLQSVTVKCWKCDSFENDYCKDDFDNKTTEVETCLGSACFKNKSGFGGVRQDVLRGCILESESNKIKKGCTDTEKYRKGDHHACVCLGTLCNSTQKLYIPMYYFIIPLFIQHIMKKFM